MKNILTIIVVLVIILGGAFLLFNQFIYNKKQADPLATDPKNATYIIEEQAVRLKDGEAETDIPESFAKVITKYFGNELDIDLNADGREDSVFLLTQETGGSGTFFYVVGALNTEEGFIGTEAVFLGDRIAPQTINKDSKERPGVFVVNYADRNEGEDFSVRPSLGKSIWLKLDSETMQFGEVIFDFEGEADPSVMRLDMNTWRWIRTTFNNDTEIVPKEFGIFTLTFKNDGTFSVGTDCNNMGGSYKAEGNKITFGDIFSTKKYCEGSQEDVFAEMLGNTESYNFTSKGELIFDLKNNEGQFIFR